jgi:toxin ParE1/3/4
MALEIRLTPSASRDMQNIYDWSAGQFGFSQANHYSTQVMSSIELMAENPSLARDASLIRKDLKKYVAGSHVIYFRTTKTRLTVARVLHGRQDAGNWL